MAFKDFLGKVGEVVKDKGADIAGIAISAATGNITGAISDVTNLLKGEDSEEAKALLNELEAKRMDFEREMYALEVKDRESARMMYQSADHSQANKIADNVMTYNLIIICLMVCIQVVVIMYVEGQIAAVITGIVGTITGALINERSTVVNFFFGSSAGSKEKDKK